MNTKTVFVLLMLLLGLDVFATPCDPVDYRKWEEVLVAKSPDHNLVLSWDSTKLGRPYVADVSSHYQFVFFDFLDRIKKLGFSSYMPKTFRLVYAEEVFRKAPNINVLLCHNLQSKEEMLLLVDKKTVNNSQIFQSLFAHESFHYLSYLFKTDFPNWLEEALASHFQNELYRQIPTGLILSHLNLSPWLSFEINNLTSDEDDVRSFYGQMAIYLHYVDRYIDGFLAVDILKLGKNKTWKQALNEAIQSKWSSFEDSFIDFQLAKYISKPDFYSVKAHDTEKYNLMSERRVVDLPINRKPIGFDPGPLSAFIPEDWKKYSKKENYRIFWIQTEKYGPIYVSEAPLDPKTSYPLVIRLK